ncbi:MAG: hypothetical protein E6Q61_02120 [Nitrosomonas sp.]|nr:MAG: hypothetical protein E6Q61_02120 [Nitrosomonas sp.]
MGELNTKQPNKGLSKIREIWAIYKKYEISIFPVAFATSFFLWQIFMTAIVNPAPKYENLKVLHGEITRARSAPPEFIVQLPDGKKLEMEWPVAYLLIDKSTSHGPYYGDNKKLLGCQAEIKYDSMRFTFTEHLRIWELNCMNKKIQVSNKELVKGFAISSDGLKFAATCVLAFIYICSFIRFLYDRKNHS